MKREQPNRLAGEKSPYLLQHAYNPVDWQPWGPPAFEEARRRNKPIFLSIGYSTCHWCHVMERESFSNEETAEILNRDFVPIKVDREERPDVDKLYMTAVQAMTGQGGWPLSVWLTPELKPFFGGTYFPPGPQWGRPGFSQLLGQIARLWEAEPAKIAASGEQLSRLLAAPPKLERSEPAGPGALKAGLEYYRSSFDREHGGFGGAPKFPMPVHHNFLLRVHGRDPEALRLSVETLARMAAGGIHDQLGGGFHRYSTDERWHVPHFEKMLYDNAQLAVNFLEAFQLTGRPDLAAAARDTLDYILRDLRHPEGGFYSAEDADSLPPELAGKVEDSGHEHRREGAFYVWTREELHQALGPEDAELFCSAYGVRSEGNAQEDPHGEFRGKNILYRAHSAAGAAVKLGREEAEAEVSLARSRAKLLELRSKRPRPHLDDKILTSWNGLALSAFAKASSALGEPRYLEAARAAAAFLRRSLYDPAAPRLYRRWRDGEKKVPGISDDYFFLAQGLTDLYEASGGGEWLDWALELCEQAQTLFFDPESGGYYMTAPGDDPSLLVRSKEDYDNVEPSASSVAALTLLRLERMTGRPGLKEAAEKTLALFGAQMREHPQSLPQLLVALDFQQAPPQHLVVTGEPGSPAAEALAAEARRRFLPHAVRVFGDRVPSFLKDADAGPAAYFCEDFACKLPVQDPAALGRLLDASR